VIRASYFDPGSESIVVAELESGADLDGLIGRVVGLRSLRGIPALQLERSDGSMVSLGTDGRRAVVVWLNSLEDSFHSVGVDDTDVLVYDYMGSWSEASGEWTVQMADAVECLRRFIEIGSPDAGRVLFAPD
jgi:hypothetical protein